MKKVLNVEVIRFVEMLLGIILSIFAGFGTLDYEAGLILSSSISWMPLTILGMLFVLVLLEFFNDRPYIRAGYLAITIILGVIFLITEPLSFLNASCWVFGLIYLPFLIVKCIKTMVDKGKKDISKSEYGEIKANNKTLPVSICSKKQFIIDNIYIYGMIIILAAIIILNILVWHLELNIIGPIVLAVTILLFAGLLFVDLKNNVLNRAVVKMNKEAIYADFEKDLGKIMSENLHPDTIKYITIIKSNYLAAVNKQESIVLFDQVSEITSRSLRIQQEMIEPMKCFNEENYVKAKELIDIFEAKYPKNKGLRLLKEMIRLQDINQVKEDVEVDFTINTPFKCTKINNAHFLMEYYSRRENIEKAKYYAEFILSLNTDLEEFNRSAREVLNISQN